ncbi:hypothetical protein ACTD5D_41295 [Nocardia takedensis]|uniref:hypothetical protein n=1 Tax=Nocardia takedensis TaxID=259390 RepID=UPI003F764D86
MIDEQNRICEPREPLVLSEAEKNTLSPTERKANQQIIDDVDAKLEPIVDRVRTHLQERNTWSLEKSRLNHDPLLGPHGESLTIGQARARHDALVQTIGHEADQGATRNRRFDPKLRALVSKLVWLDLPIFVYFMMGAFNISVATFYLTVGGWMRMLFAVVFGLFGTVAAARGLKILGVRHRGFKNEYDQWFAPRQGRAQLIFELAFVALTILGIATLMVYRVFSDINEAGMGTGLALVVGLVLGIASALLNYIVYVSEFRDGSTLTEQLDILAAGLDGLTRAQQGMESKINVLDEEIDKLITRGYRIGDGIRSQALNTLLGSAALVAIRYARSVHQGAGFTGQLPESPLDFSPLTVALHHLNTLEAKFLADTHAVAEQHPLPDPTTTGYEEGSR